MTDALIDFVKDHALNISIILVGTYLLRKFSMLFIRKLIHSAIRPDIRKSEKDEMQREETLIGTIDAGLHIAIWIVAAMLLVSEIGIDVAPLIAGAGIAGVALGFGAQSMVKDFLAGVFILMENQYRVGDIVELNQIVTGEVEVISLRKTVLRDLDGMVHHIPNGEITIATNMTMEYANVNLDIGIGYSEDLLHVEQVVNRVGSDLASDSDWAEKVLEAPQFLRVNEFGESSIGIKIMGKVAPMQQWGVTGELRKRLKIAFDAEGIEIPFPQRVIHQVKDTPKATAKKR